MPQMQRFYPFKWMYSWFIKRRQCLHDVLLCSLLPIETAHSPSHTGLTCCTIFHRKTEDAKDAFMQTDVHKAPTRQTLARKLSLTDGRSSITNKRRPCCHPRRGCFFHARRSGESTDPTGAVCSRWPGPTLFPRDRWLLRDLSLLSPPVFRAARAC